MTWQRSYVAISTLLGAEDAADGLSADARALADPLLRDLASGERTTRAKVLATELARLAHCLEELELGAT